MSGKFNNNWALVSIRRLTGIHSVLNSALCNDREKVGGTGEIVHLYESNKRVT